jgi:hypothetical protein
LTNDKFNSANLKHMYYSDTFNDNDKYLHIKNGAIMSALDDAMLERMAYIVFSENRPFSYRDFLPDHPECGMEHGTFRNKILAFKKADIIELNHKSGIAFYTLKGHRFGKPMTTHHMGVSSRNPIYDMIKDLPLEKNALHDIRLWFKVSSGTWSTLSTNSAFNINARSKDIKLPGIKENDIYLGMTVHRKDSVSVMVSCSYFPIAVDVNGIIRLSNALTLAKERLGQWIKESAMLINSRVYQNISIPHYDKWTVKMWHFGADSSTGYTREKFEITYGVAQDALTRIYSKQMKDNKIRIRLERQEYPNKDLAGAIEEKLYLNSNR